MREDEEYDRKVGKVFGIKEPGNKHGEDQDYEI